MDDKKGFKELFAHLALLELVLSLPQQTYLLLLSPESILYFPKLTSHLWGTETLNLYLQLAYSFCPTDPFSCCVCTTLTIWEPPSFDCC